MESLERRELFALDVTDFSNQLTFGAADTAYQGAATTSHSGLSVNLAEANKTANGVDPGLQSTALQSAAFSNLTLSPESSIRKFQSTVPSLSQVQPMLVGSGLGSELDWNAIQNKKPTETISLNVSDTNKAQQLANGDFASLFNLNRNSKSNNNRSSSATIAPENSNISVGSFCTEDGQMVIASSTIPEGEGPESGDGNSSAITKGHSTYSGG